MGNGDRTWELCRESGGEVLWHDGFCRVVLVGDSDDPGFCRVILERHLREMTDRDEAGRSRLMRDVFAVEAALRECLNLDGINLASFGNLVPHLHWHPPLRRRPAFPVGVDRPPSGRRPGEPVDPARPTAALVSRL